MAVFETKDQILLLPTFGIVRDGNQLWLTFAFLKYGLSFKIANCGNNPDV